MLMIDMFCIYTYICRLTSTEDNYTSEHEKMINVFWTLITVDFVATLLSHLLFIFFFTFHGIGIFEHPFACLYRTQQLYR